VSSHDRPGPSSLSITSTACGVTLSFSVAICTVTSGVAEQVDQSGKVDPLRLVRAPAEAAPAVA
jgi:hypothetical protein